MRLFCQEFRGRLERASRSGNRAKAPLDPRHLHRMHLWWTRDSSDHFREARGCAWECGSAEYLWRLWPSCAGGVVQSEEV